MESEADPFYRNATIEGILYKVSYRAEAIDTSQTIDRRFKLPNQPSGSNAKRSM